MELTPENTKVILEVTNKILRLFNDYTYSHHMTVEMDIAALMLVLEKTYSFVMLKEFDNIEHNIAELRHIQKETSLWLDNMIKELEKKGKSYSDEAESLK